nr:hypothetical protein [Tanacetum cinerariifolium]
MDTRSRSSTLRNEEICGNTATAYGPSIRRGSDDVPHSLDREHKCTFVRKREEEHVPIYFVSRVLQGVELNYPRMEKLIQALVHAARRLRRYFQAIELGEHDIVFQERGDETPKDFLIEVPLEDNKKEAEEKADTKPTKMELRCEWKLFTDEAASSDGSASPQTDDIIKHVHEGSCGFNAEPRSMVVRIIKKGYYWPLMHRDAAKVLQDCEKCKD